MTRPLSRRMDAIDIDGNAILDDAAVITGAWDFSGTTPVLGTIGGDVIFADGTTDVDIASHDGTNGLLLGGVLVTASAAEVNNAADVSARVQELTATGAVTVGVQSVELNHATAIVAATIADATNHQGLLIVKNTSASGTAAHTLTLTSGTFNGTNNVATLNAPNEALIVYIDSTGNGTIIENVGAVVLS